jgi:hypothetical protein
MTSDRADKSDLGGETPRERELRRQGILVNRKHLFRSREAHLMVRGVVDASEPWDTRAPMLAP